MKKEVLCLVAMFSVLLLLAVVDNSVAQRPFQCLHSDKENIFYTPAIPDFYFKSANDSAVEFIGVGNVFIGTIPPKSDKRNCSGLITSIDYCYGQDKGVVVEKQVIFKFALVQEDVFAFHVVGPVFSVHSTPQMSSCRKRAKKYDLCCDSVKMDTHIVLGSSGLSYSVIHFLPLPFLPLPPGITQGVDLSYKSANLSLVADSSIPKGPLRPSNLLLMRFVLSAQYSSNEDVNATTPIPADNAFTTTKKHAIIISIVAVFTLCSMIVVILIFYCFARRSRFRSAKTDTTLVGNEYETPITARRRNEGDASPTAPVGVGNEHATPIIARRRNEGDATPTAPVGVSNEYATPITARIRSEGDATPTVPVGVGYEYATPITARLGDHCTTR